MPPSERSQSERLYSVWFQRHDFLEMSKIMEAVKRSVVARGQGGGEKSRQSIGVCRAVNVLYPDL